MTVHREAMICVLLAATLSLAGCGIAQIEQGEPAFDKTLLVPTDSNITTACGTTPQPSQDQIRKCVYDLKTRIDSAYIDYRIVLHHAANYGNAGFDILSLGLTTAATATPTAAAKTVLAAMATAFNGTKTILNEDLLYKQTIEIVINQMDADRAQKFSVMLQEMNSATGNYTIEQAKDDLLSYLAAGTWDHAMTSLQSKVAAGQANCQSQLDNTKIAAAANAAMPQPPAVPTGCPGSNAQAGATSSASAVSVPSSLTTTAGGGPLQISISGIPADVLEVTVGVPAAQIASVTLSGASKGKTNTVDISKKEVPPAGER